MKEKIERRMKDDEIARIYTLSRSKKRTETEVKEHFQMLRRRKGIQGNENYSFDMQVTAPSADKSSKNASPQKVPSTALSLSYME